ncbi:hypothetical protein U6B65_14730 (plasmid) [Oscillospiraceae bacterium MB08-C2-2]|nr:hypothetical protein U6B65_14730 [Oscillospiraceae bacterium MB08-C2-2]
MYWLVAILSVVGIVVLLDFHPLRYLPHPKEVKKRLSEMGTKILAMRRVPLKTKVYKILGKKKDNIFVRTQNEALKTLERTGERSKAQRMERSCFFFSAAGICIGLLMGNYFLVPTLGAGLYFIPLWAIKLSYNGYIAHVNEELEVALSQITSSYMSSNNLISAVKENLGYINPPVYSAFERFVRTVESIDPSIERGIVTLQGSFESNIFYEWCNALLQCQRDSGLKSTLQPHVNKFSRQKYMQEKQRTGQMMPFREYAIMCILAPACLFGLALFSPQWFSGLINNVAGQIVIAITVVVMIVGLNKAVDIATPYQFRR